MAIGELIRTCLSGLSARERRDFQRAYLLLALDTFLQVLPATLVGWVAAILLQRALSLPEMLFYGALPLLILLIRIPLTLQIQELGFRSGYQAGKALRNAVLDRLCTLPLGALRQFRPGATAAVLTEEVGLLENFLAWHAAILYGYLVNACLLLLLLAVLDYRLGLLALMLAVAMLPLLRLAGRYVGEVHHQRRNRLDSHSETIGEFVQGMAVLRVFNAAQSFSQRYNAAVTELRGFADRTVSRVIPWLGAGRLWLELSLVAVMAAAFALWLGGELAERQLILVLIVAMMLAGPLDLLLANAVFFSMAQQAQQKLQPLLNSQPLSEPDRPQRPVGNAIHFQGVSFAFHRDRPLLQEIELCIPGGETVAIVGPSGAGKSTLLNLLVRAWDVDSGAICIGGVDLRQMSLHQLFALVALVSQQPVWLQDSIINSIRMGRPGATDEEVIAAAVAARADGFIRALPEGYATRLENAQGSLSGGELQRLSIARAMLKDAPLVLLDEITAALDAENESAIHQALAQLGKGKTVLMVAHRLHTVIRADRILVMDQGRLVAQGTHSQLLAECSLYQRLWACQQQAARWQPPLSTGYNNEKA